MGDEEVIGLEAEDSYHPRPPRAASPEPPCWAGASSSLAASLFEDWGRSTHRLLSSSSFVWFMFRTLSKVIPKKELLRSLLGSVKRRKSQPSL